MLPQSMTSPSVSHEGRPTALSKVTRLESGSKVSGTGRPNTDLALTALEQALVRATLNIPQSPQGVQYGAQGSFQALHGPGVEISMARPAQPGRSRMRNG
jgi:hypothetical protein